MNKPEVDIRDLDELLCKYGVKDLEDLENRIKCYNDTERTKKQIIEKIKEKILANIKEEESLLVLDNNDNLKPCLATICANYAINCYYGLIEDLKDLFKENNNKV